MNVLLNIVKRELASYFSTPLAYVFIVIFLTLIGSFTFYLGNFFVRGQADLNAFFAFHPWVYILLIPAVTMRLWAEERKTGTIELLMTLPLTTTQSVIGKFFAAWIFGAVEKMPRGLKFIYFKTGFDQLVMVRRIGFTGWSRRGPGSIIDLERPVDEN